MDACGSCVKSSQCRGAAALGRLPPLLCSSLPPSHVLCSSHSQLPQPRHLLTEALRQEGRREQWGPFLAGRRSPGRLSCHVIARIGLSQSASRPVSGRVTGCLGLLTVIEDVALNNTALSKRQTELTPLVPALGITHV